MKSMKCGDVGRSRVWKKTEEKLRHIVMECTNDVCGMRRVIDREERGVDGGMKKWVVRRPEKRRLSE